MNIALYTLTSPLHDEAAVNAVSKDFISSIEKEAGYRLDFKGADFNDYGTHDLDIIYIRTGGTEGLFKEIFHKISDHVVLLTSGKSNSLAASMEILSYLNQKGRSGEILHGSAEYISSRINTLAKVSSARRTLAGQNLGIIGQPSDWLISSSADKEIINRELGINLIDIDIEELISEIGTAQPAHVSKELTASLIKAPEKVRGYAEGALAIHSALKSIIARYGLSGLTLRCFDLLTSVRNTGCLSLALLNSEGIPAGCEGDVPALITMAVGQALTGQCGFQANPSRIDPMSGEILLAHCTVPFNMAGSFSLNTHFESGIGIAVHGELPAGESTIFKISGDLSRAFISRANLVSNQYEGDLCRTQIILRTEGSEEDRNRVCNYFLTDPIGNHHIVFTGDHKALFEAFIKTIRG